MQAAILIAQGLFVYALLWWIAFPALLPVNLPDYKIGKFRFTHTVGKKALLACILAALAWPPVFAIVKSNSFSFRERADAMAMEEGRTIPEPRPNPLDAQVD